MAKKNDIFDKAKKIGIDKVLPSIYEDGLQPATKELGEGLLTIAKTINLALEPLKGMVWGYEKIQKHVFGSLAEKFSKTPKERIVTPKAIIVGPLLESLKYVESESHLREMYINLLATSMDKEKIQNSHPAFVEIIKQLCPDEAVLLKYISVNFSYYQFCHTTTKTKAGDYYTPFESIKDEFVSLVSESNIENQEFALSYLDNFIRLQLIEIVNSPSEQYVQKYQRHKLDEEEYKFKQSWFEELSFTSFGIQFIEACVNEPKNR